MFFVLFRTKESSGEALQLKQDETQSDGRPHSALLLCYKTFLVIVHIKLMNDYFVIYCNIYLILFMNCITLRMNKEAVS